MQRQLKDKLEIPFNLRAESSCIFYVKDEIVIFTDAMKHFLISCASQHPKKEARLCAHLTPDNHLHEMIIVHSKGNYIPPHKHLNKIESFHLIEGQLAVVIFNDCGEVKQIIHLDSKKDFYYRLQESMFHTVVPLSEYVVFHEVTNGPFFLEEKREAKWAPKKNDLEEVNNYQRKLMKKISVSLIQ